MPHLHYDRDPGRSPLQHSWETSPLQWCLGAHSQATGHTYIMEHLPYRLGRIFTPSHHECHQLRCVSAVMLCVGSGANRRDTPSFDPFEYPSPPVSVFSTVPPLRGKSFHAVETSKTLSIGLLVNTFVAFSGDCNQVMHALNGNYTWYPSFCPKPHSCHWSESFFIPNGMRVFRYEFFSKDSLWLHVFRRGCSFEIETTRRESPTLYGITRHAVASKGGEPGGRWHLLQEYGKMPHRYQQASDDDTYRTTHLPYDGVQDTRRDDTYHTQHLPAYEGNLPEKPSGYQHRSAHGGCSIQSRGQRSAAARERRFHRWVDTRREARRDFRIWRSSLKDSTLRVHGGQNPLPPIHPKPTYVERHFKNIKKAGKQSLINPINHSRSARSSLTIPLPTSTHLRIMSWNVEGLKKLL